ncbi:hypothetical protein D3Z55_23580 [Clostridiaceae bacterium]|nr:hypothetical protein [Clostridiaceae bacterium]
MRKRRKGAGVMEGLEQGRLRLTGLPCQGPPFALWISQGFNRHGKMKAGVWIPEEAGKEIHTDMRVALEFTGEGSAPVFCGVVKKSTAGRRKGQSCLYIEAETGSSLLDREKRNRSFQRQGRSYQELVGEVSAPCQGYPVWRREAGGDQECGFLLQYEETDWEFIRRAASVTGNGLLPECRFAGNGFYVGLPDSQGETRLEASHYSIRSRIPGSILEDGTICAGPEYVIKDCSLTLYPGDRVRFCGQCLAVAGKESRLEGGMLKNTYLLRGEDSFRTARLYNYSLIGASIAGKVTESGPDQSRLKLCTDGEGEAAESWHSRPVFYSGGGSGYSGRPEQGDTLYLYFPTEDEEARCVIGGGGAGYETLQTVTQQIMDDTAEEEEEAEKNQPLPMGVEVPEREGAAQGMAAPPGRPAPGKAGKANASSMAGYKNWSTPGKHGVSLNPAGIRLQTGGGSAMGMGGGGISLSGSGDARLKGKNGIEIDMLHGKQIMLKAKEYIYIQCGMSAVAVLPGEIHLKGTQAHLDSPLSEKTETVLSDSAIAGMKEMYYNMKWGSPLQLFMPDGTVIGREKGLEQNAALQKYFEENVLGTEGYENNMDAPALKPLYKDGTLDPAERELYENSLYLKWLSATYGKTDMEKLGDWLMTKEGRHAALDVFGICFDVADVVNGVLYLTEGDWGNAALSGICALPLLGDFLGKAGKGTKYLLKLTDLSKLKRNEKVSDTLKRLDLFFKARRADISDLHKWIRKSWDDLIDGGGYAAEYVTPDGMIYRIRTSDDFRVNINLMDEAGDMMQDTLQAGKKADDAGGKLLGKTIKDMPSTLSDWSDKVSDLSKQAPIEIPSNATVKVQAKNGYDQISFKWTENGKNYEVRWHTKTPGAPEGQGNTWVVTRTTPGTPTGQVKTQHILVGDTWIPRYQWQNAINAYKNGTATPEQLQLLKDGHWQAP